MEQDIMYSTFKEGYIRTPDKIKAFLEEYKLLCKKHNISIAHQDWHGAFILEEYKTSNIRWLNNANIAIDLDNWKDYKEDFHSDEFTEF